MRPLTGFVKLLPLPRLITGPLTSLVGPRLGAGIGMIAPPCPLVLAPRLHLIHLAHLVEEAAILAAADRLIHTNVSSLYGCGPSICGNLYCMDA